MSDQQNPHTFWVAPRPSTMEVYHVESDCGRLKGDPREKDHAYVEWHELDLCKWCDPDRETPYE